MVICSPAMISKWVISFWNADSVIYDVGLCCLKTACCLLLRESCSLFYVFLFFLLLVCSVTSVLYTLLENISHFSHHQSITVSFLYLAETTIYPSVIFVSLLEFSISLTLMFLFLVMRMILLFSDLNVFLLKCSMHF